MQILRLPWVDRPRFATSFLSKIVDHCVEIRRLKVSEKLTAIGSNSQWKDPRVTLFTVSGATSHLNLRVENHSGSNVKLTAHWAVFLWAIVK